MGRRPRQPSVEYEPHIEHLRKGTREQYESAWVSVTANTDVAPTSEFTHELGEVPWVVDVIRADDSDGYNAEVVPSTDVTITKTDTLVTLAIPTSVTVTYYYQVRAM
jgi:hypothetical protein